MFACSHSTALSNLIDYKSAAQNHMSLQLYVCTSKDLHLQRVDSNVGVNSERPHLLSATI